MQLNIKKFNFFLSSVPVCHMVLPFLFPAGMVKLQLVRVAARLCMKQLIYMQMN